MRIVTQTIKLYTATELKNLYPQAYKKAWDQLVKLELEDDFWSDSATDFIKERLLRLGFDIKIESWNLYNRDVRIAGTWEPVSDCDWDSLAEEDLQLDQGGNQAWFGLKTELVNFTTSYEVVRRVDFDRSGVSDNGIEGIEDDQEYIKIGKDFDYRVLKAGRAFILDILQSGYEDAQSEETFLQACESNEYEFDCCGNMQNFPKPDCDSQSQSSQIAANTAQQAIIQSV